MAVVLAESQDDGCGTGTGVSARSGNLRLFFDHRFAGFSCGRWFFAPFLGGNWILTGCQESEVTGMDVTGNGSAGSVERRKIALKIERGNGNPCRRAPS